MHRMHWTGYEAISFKGQAYAKRGAGADLNELQETKRFVNDSDCRFHPIFDAAEKEG